MRYECAYYGCPFVLPVPELPEDLQGDDLVQAAISRYDDLSEALAEHRLLHLSGSPVL